MNSVTSNTLNQLKEMLKITFQFIKGLQFLPTYCNIPYTAWTKHKMNGKGDRGRPVNFTYEEICQIEAGVTRMFSDIKKEISAAKKKSLQK